MPATINLFLFSVFFIGKAIPITAAIFMAASYLANSKKIYMINKIVSVIFLSLLLIIGTVAMIVIGGILAGAATFHKIGTDLVKVINDELDLNDVF